MKKNLTKIFLTAGLILSFGGLVSSCSKDNTEPKPGTDPTGDPNKYITTNVITPIRYTESEFIGGDEGVSIKVTEVKPDNIKFVCEPGADISSYLIQVYPMATIYNSLLNEMNNAELTSLPVETSTGFLSAVLQEGTAPGKLVNKESAGEDFASYEMSYMDSELQSFQVQPDIDYLIVVLASFDNDAKDKNFGKLGICHVCTPKKELVGSPTIDMRVDIASSSTEYRVTHMPNDDCHFYYYLCSETSQIQQFIDVYGEDMYRKLLCHYGGKGSTEDLDALTFTAQDGIPGNKYTTTALALDVNGTPAPRVFRKDFELPKIPEDAEVAKCTFDFPDKIGASIIRNTAHLEKTCKAAHYRIYKKAEADAIMNGDEKSKATEAYSIAKEGWSIGNPNFKFDRENNVATGGEYSRVEFNPDLTGDTEYVMLYVGKNYYNVLSPIQATEPFRTKKLVRDQPNASAADILISSPKTTRTGVTMAFSYNKDNTAIYYFQYYQDGPNETFPTPEDSSDEARLRDKTGWLHWLIDARVGPLLSPWPNVWYYTASEPEEVFEYGWKGFDPKTKYNFCYVGEDWNGILGPVKFFNATTLEAIGGSNPQVEIAATAGTGGIFKIDYKSNADTRSFRYLACSINSSGAKALALQDLKNKSKDITYEEYIASWKEYSMAQGLVCYEYDFSHAVQMDGDFMVAMAMAIGGDDGTPVYSDLATLVFSNNKIQTLEEYLGVPGKKASSMIPSLRSDYKSGPERISRDARIPSWKLQD